MKKDLIKIDELIELLPDHPEKSTIYGWIRQKKVPHYKYGRCLFFSKSEILDWNEQGRNNSETSR